MTEESFRKSMLPKEQGSGLELVFQEENNGLSGSIQAICMQKHEDKNKTLMETRNYMGESDYPTEESKKEFVCESFKIDENEILNQDEKLKQEAVKLFLDKFLGPASHPKHYGETVVLDFVIHKMKSEKMNVEYQLENEV